MKKYVIINDINNEIDSIDWSTLDQDGIDLNLMDFMFTRMVISYEGEMPSCIEAIENKSQEYLKEEIVLIMSSPDWAIYVELCSDCTQEYDDHIKFYQEVL